MYTTQEKIAYFESEKIPNIKVQIEALLAVYDNDTARATKESWQYRKALESLIYSEKRLAELQKEQEFFDLVGNKPSTTLEIAREILFQICAEKTLEFEIEETKYLRTKFKAGKAQFEFVILSCYGLTLRCRIENPTIYRDKEINKYKISFEYKTYTASPTTKRSIEALRKS